MFIYNHIGQQFSLYKQKDAKMKNAMRRLSNDFGIQADDFVAILIYVIIKAECSDVLPYIEVIQAFTLTKRQFSFEYMKASLQGSVEFITQSIDDYIKKPGDTPDKVMVLSK